LRGGFRCFVRGEQLCDLSLKLRDSLLDSLRRWRFAARYNSMLMLRCVIATAFEFCVHRSSPLLLRAFHSAVLFWAQPIRCA
jgi:hypothetical protein